MFSKDSLPVPEHIWTPWSDMISLYSTHFNTGSGGYPNHIESPAGNSHIRFFQQAWRPRDEIRLEDHGRSTGRSSVARADQHGSTICNEDLDGFVDLCSGSLQLYTTNCFTKQSDVVTLVTQGFQPVTACHSSTVVTTLHRRSAWCRCHHWSVATRARFNLLESDISAFTSNPHGQDTHVACQRMFLPSFEWLWFCHIQGGDSCIYKYYQVWVDLDYEYLSQGRLTLFGGTATPIVGKLIDNLSACRVTTDWWHIHYRYVIDIYIIYIYTRI